MREYVIYKMSTNEIVRLTTEQPSFSNIQDDEDFDTVKNLEQVPEAKEKIEAFRKRGN